jgi:hypothetical protein
MFRSQLAVLMLVSAASLGAVACKPKEQDTAARAPMAGTEYRIVLHSRWTPANFPFEYPTSNPLTGPHFSGLIGATHNASYEIFTEGAMPTPGLERLSEEGKHDPLDAEIRAALAAGSAGALIETGPLRDFTDSLVTTVRVDSAHSMISIVAMIAPSPDWFAGARNVDLMENGAWVASRTVDLRPYDSGGDDGTTYKAPDKDNNPKKPTTANMSRHFQENGAIGTVGTVTITRVGGTPGAM